jgi:two-component system sensor histidine kinase YesM
MIRQIIKRIKQKRYSIGFRLLTITILLILCSVVIVSSLSYYRYTKDFQRQSSDGTYQTIVQFSYNLESYLNELFQLSEAPYYNSVLMNELNNDHPTSTYDQLKKTWAIEDQLNDMLISSRKDIFSAYIISDNVIYRGGTYSESIDSNANYKEYSWYQKALTQDDAIYVPTHMEELTNNPKTEVFSIVRRISNIEDPGELLGVLKIDANYNAIESISDQINMGKDGGVFIVDQNSSIIYSSIKNQNLNQLFKLVQAQKSHSTTTTIKNKKFQVNWVVIPSAKWTIISLNSVSELNKNAIQTRNATFLMAMLCSMLAIIILVIFTKSFLRPLLKIVMLMKEVQNGNFKVEFPAGRNDEIGYLGSSFNTMVYRISSMMEENTRLVSDVYESKLLQNEAQINALYSQIRPHFLFNTLNMISLLIRTGKNDIAADNIEKLSDLLRCMTHFNKEITLKEELQLLNSYLSIQHTRYKDRLEYMIDIDKRLYPYVIPALTFQPIVENTIIHGCEKSRAKTTIKVYSLFKDDYLIFVIEDNAKGMNKEALEALREKVYGLQYSDKASATLDSPDMRSGIGLVNVNKRIKIKFGNQYGLVIDSVENEGTSIKVLLPKPLNMEDL